MSNTSLLFGEQVKVINIGTPKFKEDLDLQGVEAIQVEWKPPAGGNTTSIRALDRVIDNQTINEANEESIRRIKAAHPILVDIEQAIHVIPNMHKKKILHAGPPINWENMCGPMQGAIIGALIYEGLATNEVEAKNLAQSGEIEFSPCNEHGAVGPMAGIISPSMPVHVIKNITHGNKAFCTVNEGLGKVLRFGAYSSDVIDRLKWIEHTYAPILKEALAIAKGIDLKSLIAQALHMGDECHNRNKAATSLFLKDVIGYLLEVDEEERKIKEAIAFIKNNEHYFLNLSMPSCKASLDAGHGVPYATVVTTMARNGVEFGIRVSGLGENEWFTAPANFVEGLLFPGYTIDDAAPDLGDSAITETMGIGGFAMGGAPAIVQFVGGTVDDAIDYSTQMYEITTDENNNYSISTLDFRGSALGIDIRKVIETGILPVINTGMAHKNAGIGQVGAGIVHPPIDCFNKAIIKIEERYFMKG